MTNENETAGGMEKFRSKIWKETEYNNPVPGEFIPHIVSYIHSGNSVLRDAVLIVPGGGYRMVACSEGEIVAEKFYQKGYNTFVLTYTTALFTDITLGRQPLKDLARAVVFLRDHADRFHIRPDHLGLCGFSAGGHLSATLAVHWNDPEICPDILTRPHICRPDAVILSYPVITAGKYAHKDSFQVLLGNHSSAEDQNYFSVEKQVGPDTPPSFLWHTSTDETVPVENSLLYWNACRSAGVSCTMHIFSEGPHGYSLADDRWASGTYGGDYAMEQWFAFMQYYIDQGEPLPAPFQDLHLPAGTNYRDFYRSSPKDYLKGTPNPEVAQWPDLADQWLRQTYQTFSPEEKGGSE